VLFLAVSPRRVCSHFVDRLIVADRLSQSGSFRSSRMFKPGTGVLFLHRQFQSRLSTARRPLSRSVFRQLAEFHAAPMHVSCGAVAIARLHLRVPQLLLCIRHQNQRSAKQTRTERNGGDPEPPRKRLLPKRCTHAAIFQGVSRKTDSARRPKILLPGSWNEVGYKAERGTSQRSRFSFVAVPIWLRRTHLGRYCSFLTLAKHLLINDLVGTRPRASNGAARALENRMSAFHMTSWEERRARGKGLAHRFSQFVPTCL
jgi:hypothetical protein